MYRVACLKRIETLVWIVEALPTLSSENRRQRSNTKETAKEQPWLRIKPPGPVEESVSRLSSWPRHWPSPRAAEKRTLTARRARRRAASLSSESVTRSRETVGVKR